MMTMRHAVEASALILTIAGSVLAAPSPSFAGEQARSVNDPVEATPERLATSTFPMGVVTTDITKTEQQGSQRHITITADVLFDFDSVEVNPEFAAKIPDLIKEIPQNAKDEVAGHTDSIGSEELNQKMSEDRAKAVADEITKSRPDLKITTKGYGETEPVAENEKNGEDNPEGRAQNRRVEITYN
ncbi:OmpA family protein [Pseudoclavibacter alba]|uniref:OmpA family protein n=1 Tax=Pseudoclavibacter albus TaxID=272241 RepID=A0ABT2HVD3_9MICO|nr:OmpA family protein [Pseudoclavibacter alba]MCT2042272.1 OmpA family protein [Pseudoclavibacter alba]